MSAHTPSGLRGSPAYTLLELLVALAIALMMFVFSTHLILMMMTRSTRVAEMLQQGGELTEALRILETDLNSLVAPGGEAPAMVLIFPSRSHVDDYWDPVVQDRKPDHIALDPSPQFGSNMENERWGRCGVRGWFWISHARHRNNDPGGIYAVAYQISRFSGVFSTEETRYCLTRAQVSAHQSFLTGYRWTHPVFSLPSPRLDPVWHPSVIENPQPRHILLRNVIDFGMRLWSWNAVTHAWECRFPGDFEEGAIEALPDMIEVMFRVLDEEGARLIADLEAGRIHGDWWEIADEHSSVIVRRFPVRPG